MQKWPQKWSVLKGKRRSTEKSRSPSDSSWFETFDRVKFLFVEPFLMGKSLGQRRKKSLTGGPPDFARRAPLRRSWRKVLRTNRPQKCSVVKGSREPTEKSRSPSDSSWFETKSNLKLLFLEPFLMGKMLAQRSKKTLAGGPPDFARRAPLRPSWRRVLRTICCFLNPYSGCSIGFSKKKQ